MVDHCGWATVDLTFSSVGVISVASSIMTSDDHSNLDSSSYGMLPPFHVAF